MIARRTPTEPTPPPAVSEHRPGYCAEHPNQVLVKHAQAGNGRGRYWYGLEDPATVCVLCPTDDDERCRWCGGPLYPPPAPPVWQRSTRRSFCSSADRLRAHRAEKAAGRG